MGILFLKDLLEQSKLQNSPLNISKSLLIVFLGEYLLNLINATNKIYFQN